MNTLERVLSDDIARLIDRLATSLPEGLLTEIGSARPDLRARLEGTESRLAEIRASLVDDYARWTRALDDLENLWALAAWRAAEEPADRIAA